MPRNRWSSILLTLLKASEEEYRPPRFYSHRVWAPLWSHSAASWLLTWECTVNLHPALSMGYFKECKGNEADWR